MRVWTDIFAGENEFVNAMDSAHRALRRVFDEDSLGVEIAATALLMRSIARSGVSLDLMLHLSEEIFENEH
jgi:hypothetical protein